MLKLRAETELERITFQEFKDLEKNELPNLNGAWNFVGFEPSGCEEIKDCTYAKRHFQFEA